MNKNQLSFENIQKNKFLRLNNYITTNNGDSPTFIHYSVKNLIKQK